MVFALVLIDVVNSSLIIVAVVTVILFMSIFREVRNKDYKKYRSHLNVPPHQSKKKKSWTDRMKVESSRGYQLLLLLLLVVVVLLLLRVGNECCCFLIWCWFAECEKEGWEEEIDCRIYGTDEGIIT